MGCGSKCGTRTSDVWRTASDLIVTFATYLLVYFMEQCPSWGANWFLASQENPCILWNPKVHYPIHKCLPPVPIQASSIQYIPPTSHSLKIHLNIIISIPGSPKWFFPSGFPTKTLHTSFPSPLRATCPTGIILLDFITWTILGEEYRSLSSSLCSFLHSPVTSSLLGPGILFSTLFCNNLNLRFSLNVRDQVSQPRVCVRVCVRTSTRTYTKSLALSTLIMLTCFNPSHKDAIHKQTRVT